MRYLILIVILSIIHHAYGYPSESEYPKKFKLSSGPGYFAPKQRSNRRYEHQVGPPDHNVKRPSSDRKDDDGKYDHKDDVSRYELYKPVKTYGPFGPNEEDSKYIPHSEPYSKYVTKNSQTSPDSKEKHDWKDHDHRFNGKDSDKSEEIPRYGFVKQNHQSSHIKHYEDEDDEDLPKKHHDDYLNKKQSYGIPSNDNSGSHKYYEHDKVRPETYSEDGKEDRYHHYPEPDTEHKHPKGAGKYTNHYYTEPKEHRHPRYQEEEEDYHPHSDQKKYGYRNYPEYKKNYDHHDYPDHEKSGGHHHYPEHEEKNEPHPYSEHKEKHVHEDYPETKEKHEHHHYPEHEEDKDKYPPRYQPYKPTRPLPIRHSLRLAEEIKSNIHRIPLRFNKLPKHYSRHEDKVSNVPKVKEFVEEHKISSHKHPHDKDEQHESHHDHPDDSKKGHYLINHQPHVDKDHPEHNYKPNYNVGGLSYGWMYKPKFDLYHQMEKDLDTKMRLLKEHDEKLAELQRNHLEKYQGLFKPQYAKNFFNHELPKNVAPDVDSKYHSHTSKHDDKKKSEDSDVEVYVEREPKEHHHHYHYDNHHPKHTSTGKESTHYHDDPHHYHKDD